MKLSPGLQIMTLAIVGTIAPLTCSHAQTVSDEHVAAYRKGFDAGWSACRNDPGCAGPGTRGTGLPGTYAGFELPGSLFPGAGPGTSGKFTVPADWYLAPSVQGQGVIGSVETDGQFRPFVVKPSGEIDLLPANELPVWTTEPDIKGVFSSLPKGEGGFVFVPVQPSSE